MTVTWEGLSGCDYLGANTYASGEEFKADSYYAQLVEDALDELNKKLIKLRTALAQLDSVD